MHPARPPAGSGVSSREAGRRDTPPMPPEYPARPPSAQPSLPSIRQLHPYLPPSSLAVHSSMHADLPPAPYGSSGPYSHSSMMEPTSLKRGFDPSGIDSDADDGDHTTSPPKKKRRRQALSCTECKRRKIKCDRTQPCTPCTRRGEQSRCQWHIVEPVEKYVTRAEYDDLRARFEDVSAKVDRLQQLCGSIFQTGLPPGHSGTSSEAMSTFSSSGTTSLTDHRSERYPTSPPSFPNTESIDSTSEPDSAATDAQRQSAGVIGTSETVAPLLSLHHNPFPSRYAVKKLPRADVQTGRTSAHRLSSSIGGGGYQGPSSSSFREGTSSSTSKAPPQAGPSSEMRLESSGSSSNQLGASSVPKSPDSIHQRVPSSRDGDRGPMMPFMRDR